MSTCILKTPLRYPGGKSRAVKLIVDHLPKDFKEFREPMVGGGSVFLFLKQKYPDRQFWINDIDEDLISFWISLRDNANKLVETIFDFKNMFDSGRSLFNFLKKVEFNNDPVMKGARYYVLNRITFSGLVHYGGYSEEAYLKRFTDARIKYLKEFSNVLKGIKITCGDYSSLIKAEGEKVTIYLDPPYYNNKSSKLYGQNGNLHVEFDHQRLAYELYRCQHNWLVTYDDSEYIRELFNFAKISEYELKYGMDSFLHQTKLGKEVIVHNEFK